MAPGRVSKVPAAARRLARGPHRLRPEDRADFEALLHLALSTQDIRNALLADPSGQASGRLRAQALDAADEITAATGEAYGAYLAVRAAARDTTPRPTPEGTLLPALAVLTPLVAASSAAVLLLLGHVFRLAHVSGTLPGALVTAGWVLALVAAVSALVALAALVCTGLRRRGGPPSDARLEQARLAWHQALLGQGLLPHLRRCVTEDPFLHAAPPT
ncbi:hypothetical protein [Streptomyces bluensis]|uniref:hypothetical protein n=1 Tax=Streptomyces bluensis TaxID=33897 RepID=UPI00332AC2E1